MADGSASQRGAGADTNAGADVAAALAEAAHARRPIQPKELPKIQAFLASSACCKIANSYKNSSY
ncbi:hypothetical protein [Acidovorax sp.]|uniref:hypothetical protein n=1 Tax=Acidovorax sp. TaxID=1872122 RepID=UPI00391B188E